MAHKLQIQSLADPPREIPAGVRLRILAHYDVVGTLLFLVPALVFLLIGVASPVTPIRVVSGVLGMALLIMALASIVPSLRRSSATLRRMRSGYLAVGRIVECRFAWDKRRHNLPFREFMGDWVAHMGRSQMRKATGCLVWAVGLIFFLPMALFLFFLVVASAIQALGLFGADPTTQDFEALDLVQFVASSVSFLAVAALWMVYWRRKMVAAVGPFIESQRRRVRRSAEEIEAELKRLMALAGATGEQVVPRDPLPDDRKIPIACTVEYSLAGVTHVVTARAWLTQGLNLLGVERLIFDPGRPDEADLLIAMPPEIGVEAGQWRSDSGVAPAAGLLATGALLAIGFAAAGTIVAALWAASR